MPSRDKRKWTAYMREYQRKRRRIALDFYGGQCECCGESRLEFLSFDHIAGGGSKHNKYLRKHGGLVNWLFKHKFPAGFRVLCHNCNQSLGFYGRCPHNAND